MSIFSASVKDSSYSANSSFYKYHVQQYIIEPIQQVFQKYCVDYILPNILRAVFVILQLYTCLSFMAIKDVICYYFVQYLVQLLVSALADAFADTSYIILQKTQINFSLDATSIHFTYEVVTKSITLLVFIVLFAIFSRKIFAAMTAGSDFPQGWHALLITLLFSIATSGQVRELYYYLHNQYKISQYTIMQGFLFTVQLLLPLLFSLVRQQSVTLLQYVWISTTIICVFNTCVFATSFWHFSTSSSHSVMFSFKRLFPFRRKLVSLLLLKSMQNGIILVEKPLLYVLCFYISLHQPNVYDTFQQAYQLSVIIYLLIADLSLLPTEIVYQFLVRYISSNYCQKKYSRIRFFYTKQVPILLIVQFVYSFIWYLCGKSFIRFLISGCTKEIIGVFDTTGVYSQLSLAFFYGVLQFLYVQTMLCLRIIVIKMDIASIIGSVIALVNCIIIFVLAYYTGKNSFVMHNILADGILQLIVGLFMFSYIWRNLKDMKEDMYNGQLQDNLRHQADESLPQELPPQQVKVNSGRETNTTGLSQSNIESLVKNHTDSRHSSEEFNINIQKAKDSRRIDQ